MGKHHVSHPVHDVRPVVAHPAQLGDGVRRIEHAAGQRGTPIGATQLLHQLGGRIRTAHVVPQQCVVHRIATVVEGDHPVLLPADGHRVGPVEQRTGGLIDSSQPRRRVNGSPRRVGGAPLVDHPSVGRIHEHGLGRLGRGVDAEDEGCGGHAANVGRAPVPASTPLGCPRATTPGPVRPRRRGGLDRRLHPPWVPRDADARPRHLQLRRAAGGRRGPALSRDPQPGRPARARAARRSARWSHAWAVSTT